MLDVKIVSSVSVAPISEEKLSELIKAELKRTNPELTVNGIEYSRKLSPNRIVATVTACLTNSTESATVTEIVAPDNLVVESVDEPEDKPLAEVKPVENKAIFG